jgi:hypothetical protein
MPTTRNANARMVASRVSAISWLWNRESGVGNVGAVEARLGRVGTALRG